MVLQLMGIDKPTPSRILRQNNKQIILAVGNNE